MVFPGWARSLTGILLHLWTVGKAFSAEGWIAAGLALVFFGFAQLVWFVKTFEQTHRLLSPFHLSCLAYLALFVHYQVRKRLRSAPGLAGSSVRCAGREELEASGRGRRPSASGSRFRRRADR